MTQYDVQKFLQGGPIEVTGDSEKVSTKFIWREYADWCGARGIKPKNDVNFSKVLGSFGLNVHTWTHTRPQLRSTEGVRVKPEALKSYEAFLRQERARYIARLLGKD